ncbi:hypothetical protein J7E45_17800 [Microbacterium sp. ISL-59]|uniref:hypothetical protein n=1 Tax=Microbacterium sp. ISL-59 TaxID=2819159 RepID=UPI001BEC85A1|nr:hypothetical protein [Microbacterium sp. ISL-59]MBT2497463.1 hypothetical protein [Microbacterium sp. ISL-59]
MMSTVTPRPPLPRWVWITVAAVVAAAVVVGVVVWAQRPTDDTATPPATAEPSATPGASDELVTGCLAEGQGIDMLLATQKAAPHSEVGAVEFATAATRWLKRWPWPSADEYQTSIEQSWDSDHAFAQGEYDALVAGPNASGGIVAEGTPFRLTAAVGRWYVDSYDGDTAQVSVGLSYVIGEAVSPLYRSAGTYNLDWTEDGWKITSIEPKHTVQDLFDDGLGSPYAGGC